MDAKVCDQCGVRLDEGREFFTIQVCHMEKVGVIHKNEQLRDLCTGCEVNLRLALNAIDADKNVQYTEFEKLGYDYVWIIIDKDNFIHASCWSKTFRDSYLRVHPDYVAIRFIRLS